MFSDGEFVVRAIAVGSGKGGVGKTTMVANLGIALAQLGKKVIMVDADLDMANLELALGMEGRPITLQDVLAGEAQVRDVIYDVHGAKFVPAGISPSQFKRVDPERFAKIIDELKTMADFVLLDCPAGIGKDTIACLSACEETILVMTPEPMSATDAYKTKLVAEKMGSDVIGIILNMIKGLKSELKEKEITSLLNAPILARIKSDDEVEESVLAGKPIVVHQPDNASVVAIKKLAAGLVGVAYIHEAPKTSLIRKFFGFFGRKK